MDKVALLTGVTGQTGSYLAELLLSKDVKVVGVARRTSTDNTERIRGILQHPNFLLIEGDLTDMSSMLGIFDEYKPDFVYNLAAQSHVQTSFSQPDYTTKVNYGGVLNLLEIIRKISPTTHFIQASSSEMMGSSVNKNGLQDENTPFIPQSPYAISKVAAHHLVALYRQAYGISASAYIGFNHESPRRGEKFVTRKITMYVARLATTGVDTPLLLGNLNARRDWSHAKDIANGIYRIMQQETPDDYVLASGECHTVREFAALAFSHIGKDYQQYIQISPAFYRPAEVNYLRGDASKAKRVLGWSPTISFSNLVKEMVDADISRLK